MIEKVGTSYVDAARMSSKPTCFEFGANIGKTATAILKRFGGTITAFEPGSIGDQIKPFPGLTIRREAVASCCGAVTFYDLPQQPISSSLCRRTPKRGSIVPLTVQRITPSIIFRGIDWIDFINLDIEGGEWDLLDSQAESFRRVDQLCVEFHTEFSNGATVEEVVSRVCARAFFDARCVEQHKTRPVYLFIKQTLSPRLPGNKWIRQCVEGCKAKRVLNLGCGEDHDQEGGLYSSLFKDAEVVRCDIEKKNGVDVVASSEHLPFKEAEFDFVFANWMIYKTDVTQTLKEIARVTAPDAGILITHGHKNRAWMKAITASCHSLVNVQSEFMFNYPARGSLRLAQGVFGMRRSDADKSFCFDNLGRVLLVVAHWDDEAISVGGSLATIGKGWTVVSVTHRDQEPTYQRIFESIGKECGFRAVTLDIRQRARPMKEGEDKHDYCRTIPRIPLTEVLLREKLEEKLDLSRFDTIITHDREGDYGAHPQHIEVFHAVNSIFKQAEVWSFNTRCGTIHIPLSEKEMNRKMELIRKYKPNFKPIRVGTSEYFSRAGRS